MQQPWRFVDTCARDAASNMALDEALLVMHEAGATLPTLRVYGWCQPTLSLGYAQNAHQEVDLAACQAQGVAVVRRPTGGRAVLHDQEVTYSVVMPLALEDGPHTITEHYRRIGMALAAALQALGLPVQLARPQVRTAPTRQDEVARELRRRIQVEFQKQGIPISSVHRIELAGVSHSSQEAAQPDGAN